MPTRLNKDFQPTDQTYNNLAKHGAIKPFVDHELEMFKAYFLDPELPDGKAKKSSWQMTCQRWMREAWRGRAGKAWEREQEFKSQHRPFTPKPQGNLFEEVLAGKIAGDMPKPEKTRIVYHKPVFEQVAGPAMSFEEASAVLRKMRLGG